MSGYGPGAPREVDVDQLAELLTEGVYVLDVREPGEYTSGHVPGAVPMPLQTVPERHEELPREQTVYVVCASGGRSAQAAQYLAAVGVDAVNVDGGTRGWIASGRDVVGGTEPA